MTFKEVSGEPGDSPNDPLAAATHPNPYPYYTWLAAERPLYRDARLQLWVAAGAGVVAQVLASELCHVRPVSEPVPHALGNTAAAMIFGGLVRMNDGDQQRRCKQAIAAALGSLEREAIVAAACRNAVDSSRELRSDQHPEALTRFMLMLPVRTMATLLGVPAERIGAVAEWAAAFASSIAATASAAEIEQGASAAAALLEQFHELLATQRSQPCGALLGTLAREVGSAGTDAAIVANGIGLMSQSYEATAGLIGNTLLALAREPSLHEAVRRTPALLATLIQRVLHLDPPTQSTRRFVVRDGSVAGQPMQAGETILVLLAAAGRDSGLLPPPGDLANEDWSRAPGNFGAGRHACPASSLAALIAEGAVAHLLALGLELRELTARYRYRTSNHVRVPLFR
jgi:cytochrome P450